VVEDRESRARRYALADHARRLGWSPERVLAIDEDLGLSGRSADTRLGFLRLLAEVTMDHSGASRRGDSRPEKLDRIRALAADILDSIVMPFLPNGNAMSK
jgi:hypothetical protein